MVLNWGGVPSAYCPRRKNDMCLEIQVQKSLIPSCYEIIVNVLLIRYCIHRNEESLFREILLRKPSNADAYVRNCALQRNYRAASLRKKPIQTREKTRNPACSWTTRVTSHPAAVVGHKFYSKQPSNQPKAPNHETSVGVTCMVILDLASIPVRD